MIQLLHIDCMEFMKGIPDKYYDLAIVDPPYGIGEDGHCRTRLKHNYKVRHIKKNWDNERPSVKYWDNLFRISKNQIVWGGNYFVKYLKPSMGWIVWNKLIGGDFSDCELAYTSFDRALQLFEYWNGNNGIPRIHPTQKPVQLYKWLLKNYAKPEFKIIDTHLGSGSSAIACYDFGIAEFTGCEIDREYYESALNRFNIHKMQKQLEFK